MIGTCLCFTAQQQIPASLPEILLSTKVDILHYYQLSHFSKNNSGSFGRTGIMAPRKKNVTSAVARAAKSAESSAKDAANKPQQQDPQLRRFPCLGRFALVVLSSLVSSSLLFTSTSGVTVGELGNVSKHLEEWWEVGGLIIWKSVEVGLPWVLGFDRQDVLSFIFLTHLPTFTLLSSFYGVRPTTIVVSYAITLFSTAIPFIFLRQPASVHNPHASAGAISNRSILEDRLTTIYTTLAATSIFTVVQYISYATWLPAYLVLNFEGIPDISAAHAGPAQLPILFLSALPAGWAARDILFVSSAGASSSSSEPPAHREGEYLACTIYRKTWGSLSTKMKVLVSRTVILASMVLLNTIVQVAGTVKGVGIPGAAGWGAVWAVATLIVGGTFGWIEAVDGV